MQQHGRGAIDRWSGRKRRTLACAAGAMFLIMLDSNIVAVSLPSIGRDLRGAFTDVEWVVSAYLLPFAALIMPGGALADRHGRRRILTIGLMVFTIASLLCGLAPSLAVLNTARAVQGVGAALQLSGAIAIITHGFEPRERVQAFAIVGTVLGLAPSLGPILGGIVTSTLGWRWAFLLNLPVGLLLVTLAVTSIDESRDLRAERLDIAGILLFGAGLFSLIWALIGANSAGWESSATLLKLAVGVVLLILFVFAERAQARPMIDLSLFKRRTVVGAAIAMLGYASAAQVMMTILPLYLQDAFEQSPMTAGLAMVPFALPLLIVPGIGGLLARRLSSRAILSIGLLLVAFGDSLIAVTIFGALGYAATAIGMFVTGAGAGLLNGETTKVQVGSVPPERAGMASGIAGTTRFVGIVVGLAVLGAIIAAAAEYELRRLGNTLAHTGTLDWHELSLRIVGGDARGVLSQLPNEAGHDLRQAIANSIASGFGVALAAASVVALLAALFTWILIREEAVS